MIDRASWIDIKGPCNGRREAGEREGGGAGRGARAKHVAVGTTFATRTAHFLTARHAALEAWNTHFDRQPAKPIPSQLAPNTSLTAKRPTEPSSKPTARRTPPAGASLPPPLDVGVREIARLLTPGSSSVCSPGAATSSGVASAAVCSMVSSVPNVSSCSARSAVAISQRPVPGATWEAPPAAAAAGAVQTMQTARSAQEGPSNVRRLWSCSCAPSASGSTNRHSSRLCTTRTRGACSASMTAATRVRTTSDRCRTQRRDH